MDLSSGRRDIVCLGTCGAAIALGGRWAGPLCWRKLVGDHPMILSDSICHTIKHDYGLWS